jgi:hypothetical protein
MSKRPVQAAGCTGAERDRSRERVLAREREREREREKSWLQRQYASERPARLRQRQYVSERPVHCRQLDASQGRLLDARDQCRRLDVREKPEPKEAKVKTQLERKREARAGDRMPAKDRCCCVGGSMCQTTT